MIAKPSTPKVGRPANGAPMSPKPTVAVLGTGIMGSAMAGRLLQAGWEVGVWSRHPDSTTALVAQGATGYVEAADAVAAADVVITMLPTGAATRAVMLQPGVLKALRSGATWVQMGTIGVYATKELSASLDASRTDVTFVDAPVSGSRAPAESGQLLILASGPPEAAGALESVFGTLGRSTMWLGPAGAGSAMKLVLNTWLAFQTEGAAESAALAARFGLRAEDLFAALRGNPLASDYALAKLGRMVEQDYHVDFSLEWASKDLDLVTTESSEAAPVVGAIATRWHDLLGEGWGGADVSAARNGLESTAPRSEGDGR